MSPLLAVETSGRQTSVAALRENMVVFHQSFISGRRETGPLFSLVQSALATLDTCPVENSLRGIVVGTGPGSYNGLRAGLALAAGLGLALNVPVGGWSSLLGLPAGRWVAGGDARGGQWYLAVVADGTFLEEPVLYPAARATDLAAEKASEWQAHRAWLGESPPGNAWQPLSPSAERLLLVARAWLARQNPFPPEPALWPSAHPLYLKEPCITAAKAPATPAAPGTPAK